MLLKKNKCNPAGMPGCPGLWQVSPAGVGPGAGTSTVSTVLLSLTVSVKREATAVGSGTTLSKGGSIPAGRIMASFSTGGETNDSDEEMNHDAESSEEEEDEDEDEDDDEDDEDENETFEYDAQNDETAEEVSARKTRAESLKQQANTAYGNKRLDQAAALYSQALDLDPANHVLYSNRAAVRGAQKRWSDCAADATACVRLKGDFHKVCCRRFVSQPSLFARRRTAAGRQ